MCDWRRACRDARKTPRVGKLAMLSSSSDEAPPDPPRRRRSSIEPSAGRTVQTGRISSDRLHRAIREQRAAATPSTVHRRTAAALAALGLDASPVPARTTRTVNDDAAATIGALKRMSRTPRESDRRFTFHGCAAPATRSGAAQPTPLLAPAARLEGGATGPAQRSAATRTALQHSQPEDSVVLSTSSLVQSLQQRACACAATDAELDAALGSLAACERSQAHAIPARPRADLNTVSARPRRRLGVASAQLRRGPAVFGARSVCAQARGQFPREAGAARTGHCLEMSV